MVEIGTLQTMERGFVGILNSAIDRSPTRGADQEHHHPRFAGHAGAVCAQHYAYRDGRRER
jgi:hypothetical protein